MKKNNKINEEFKDVRPKFDKKRQEKISEDFMEFALPLIGMTREEFDEYKRKVKSGEIKIDNQL
jgi:hypothetical protein